MKNGYKRCHKLSPCQASPTSGAFFISASLSTALFQETPPKTAKLAHLSVNLPVDRSKLSRFLRIPPQFVRTLRQSINGFSGLCSNLLLSGKTMIERYRLFRRTNKVYYLEDSVTGKQESLHTVDRGQARAVLSARIPSNEPQTSPYGSPRT